MRHCVNQIQAGPFRCECFRLVRMEAGEETLSILRTVWVKLHGLPNASPVEQAAFFVILTFICESPLSFTTHSRIPYQKGSWCRCPLLSCSGGPAHGGAALRELLLLLLLPPPQDEDEGIEHLSVAGRAAKGPRESTRGFFSCGSSRLSQQTFESFQRSPTLEQQDA